MSIVSPSALFVILQHWSWLLKLVSALWYEHLLHRFRDHWLVAIANYFDFSPLEQDCIAFHHSTGPGAPVTHPIPRLVRALLVKYLFALSLRQTEELIERDLLVKWFVGYALFEPALDHSTLERFELWVITHHPCLYFNHTLRQIDRVFPRDRQSPQLVDSYAMLARAAKISLIPLLRDTTRHLLQALQQVAPARHHLVLAQFDEVALFGEKDEKDDYYLTAAERDARLHSLVSQLLLCRQAVTEQLLSAPPLPPDQQAPVSIWLERLTKILGDEVSLTQLTEQDNPTTLHVKELPNDKKGSYRIASANDPETTYRDHGKDKPAELAYNVSLMATPHFIRDIQADTGCQPDPVALPAMLATQQTHHQVVPPKVIGDRAYGNGKTRAQVEQVTASQTQLVARIPPYEQRSPDMFTPQHFTLSADGATLTCPHGVSTCLAYRSRSGDGNNFRFKATNCRACPLWDKCRAPNSKPKAHRMVFISDYRSQLDAARVYNQTDEFKQDMKLRPLIERIIYNVTNLHAGRRASRTGIANADYQAKMNATAFNLRQWIRLDWRRPATHATPGTLGKG